MTAAVPPLRTPSAADADAIADLHADSWRHTYRGLMDDAYLDGPVFAERRDGWRKRFAEPRPDQRLWVAEEDGRLLGFVCLFADQAPGQASYVDNLHVRHDAQGRGIGIALLRRAAECSLAEHPDHGMFLWVMEGNHNARDFYRRAGAEEIGRRDFPDPGGGSAPHVRCWWQDPRVLLAG